MKKKKSKGPAGAKMVLPGWMASYADMFTVLMAFFVLLFAMSIVDEDLFQAFIQSFNPARAEDVVFDAEGQMGDILLDAGPGLMPADPVPPPVPGVDYDDPDIYDGLPGTYQIGDAVSDLYNTFMTYAAEQVDARDGEGADMGEWGGAFHIEPGPTYLRITIPDTEAGLVFASGSAVLTPTVTGALNELGPVLGELSRQGHAIMVEGHTDDIPISTATFPSNRHLSGSRAGAVAVFLENNWDVDPQITFALGLGEWHPVESNATPEGRAANRRVEIKVYTIEDTEEGARVRTPGQTPAGWVIPRD
jgi:chemotaxis protein MotB